MRREGCWEIDKERGGGRKALSYTSRVANDITDLRNEGRKKPSLF